jgi:catechol 2,3-dioxygenase-like lactoylglutathione lyase family enzyme
MHIHHVGVVCRSRESADRFYGELLGLERIRSFPISRELSRGLFGFDGGFEAHTYVKGDMNVEVFVVTEGFTTNPHLHHAALGVENQERFLASCREAGVEVIQVPKGDKTITMIKDFDGNIFEIRENT